MVFCVFLCKFCDELPRESIKSVFRNFQDNHEQFRRIGSTWQIIPFEIGPRSSWGVPASDLALFKILLSHLQGHLFEFPGIIKNTLGSVPGFLPYMALDTPVNYKKHLT
jgi:hypothetical protein